MHHQGWDRPRSIFALVDTQELLAHEPTLVGEIGGDPGSSRELPPLTPVEQGSMPGETIADSLARITWPDTIAGAVLVVEIMAETDTAPAEGRMAIGVLRGRRGGICVLRWRDDPLGEVTTSPDLAPELIEALHDTFAHH